jgi:hypothetical protein
MRQHLALWLSKATLERLGKVAGQRGLTAGQYAANLLNEVVDSEGEEVTRLLRVTKKDIQTFNEMHKDVYGEDVDDERERAWLGAAIKVAADVHRERQRQAGTRYFLGTEKF